LQNDLQKLKNITAKELLRLFLAKSFDCFKEKKRLEELLEKLQ